MPPDTAADHAPHSHAHACGHDHDHDCHHPEAGGHHHTHDDDHDHNHGFGAGHHHHGANSSARTLTLALLLTLGFAIVEALGGWVTGSLALLGDAGHMLSDSLSLGLAAFAARLAQRPPSLRHSYGLGRIEALAALANGVLMLVIVAAICWEAIDRLRHPSPIQALPAAAIACIGLAVNVLAAWLLMRGERSLNVRAALLHVMGDLLGSVAAIAALLLVYFAGWQAADPILSILICLLILGSTISILRETLHVLLDGVPHGLSLDAIGRSIAAVNGVRSVHDLHVWHFAPAKVALSAHLVLDESAQWPAVLVAVRQRVQNEFAIEHLTLQPELQGNDRFPLDRLIRRAALRKD
ncbi:cation diffusion facilitator family transporter [Niveibacterium umoris]|uniref:Cobalt-zinc-cadmium efflux system protein n=1 Tax=Niveibacterium umoris TaxID=1193620 RepID=A0A840BK15_9RHOO|nr:cation diffusion facilitator family transporter [Niveibacterium umoris]MBB4011952.1 cobalt-zinc-cadmium efflux system protein [Niveibacterium umoris]